LPANIYRPGVIAGDSRTGVGNTTDLAWNMIKGAIQLEAAPRAEEAFDAAPVDYVARAIVALSLQAEGLGRAYHFPNPGPVSWNRIYDYARGLGYPLREVPLRRWLEEVYETLAKDPGHALAPFAPMLSAGGVADLDSDTMSSEALEALQAGLVENQLYFDGTNTRAGLAGTGVTCPPVEELLPAWFSYFVASGFLEPAPKAEGRSSPERP
jgi:thioester reductase-like protein